MLEHHCPGPDGADGVGDSSPCDVGGTAMHRLKEGGVPSIEGEVSTGWQAQAPHKCAAKIGEDVSKEVTPHDDVEALWGSDHEGGCGIDEQGRDGDVGVVARDFVGDLIPEHHAKALGVGLGDAGQMLASCAGKLEGVADNPFDVEAGEDSGFQSDLVRCSFMDASTDTGVLAFGVLADEDHVDVLWALVAEWSADAGEEPDGTDIDEQVEALADWQKEAPERDMVWDARGVADGAEVDRIELAELIESVWGHHGAGGAVVIGSPREDMPGEHHLASHGCFQNTLAGRDDLLPHAVTRNHRDAKLLHGTSLLDRATLPHFGGIITSVWLWGKDVRVPGS